VLHHILLSTRNDDPVTSFVSRLVLGAMLSSDDIGSNLNFSLGVKHYGIIGEQIVPMVMAIVVPELVLKLHFFVNNKILVGSLKDNLIREKFRSQVFSLRIIVPLLSKLLFFPFFLVHDITVPGFKIEVVHTSGFWCIFILSGDLKN